MNKDLKGDFCIVIDFDKSSENPERVFVAMSSLITAFKDFDRCLIHSIDNKIQPVLLLEDIETGSLKTWLRQVLNSLDDDALKKLDWKPLVGQYLVKAKYILINFLEKKTKINDAKEIKELQKDLFQLAEDTNVREFPAYSPIKPAELIESINNVNHALDNLNEKDSAYYISSPGTATFNLEFSFSPDEIEDLLTKDTLENTVKMILKVKKPDYLGTSKWEFKHENRTISAKISDEIWLKRFQNRQEDVRPGDSIKGDVKVIVKYGHDQTVIATQHDIISIDYVIRDEDSTTPLF